MLVLSSLDQVLVHGETSCSTSCRTYGLNIQIMVHALRQGAVNSQLVRKRSDYVSIVFQNHIPLPLLAHSQ